MKGSIIKALRMQVGLTQEQLASAIGVTVGRISQLERTEHGVVKGDVFARLVEVLRTKPHILLGKPQPIEDSIEEVIQVPILGFIPCELPFPDDKHREGYYAICKQLIRGNMPDDLFALKVVNNTLIGDGISEGAYMVIDKAVQFIDGKLYIVCLDNNVVARHCYRDNDHMKLVSTDGGYQDKKVNEVTIFGRVILSGKWLEH